jgi:SAM-dependent methyltransferase
VLTQIETPACLLCGAQQAQPLYQTHDRLMGVDGRFALVRCHQCGLIYLRPRPTPETISRYYPPGYGPHQETRPEQLPAWKRWSAQYGLWKRCRPIVSRKVGGRALDVGCATGLFLADLRRRGNWEVVGVEPSSEAADFAHEALGLDVHKGDLLSAQFASHSFDAVTMWDVLEHLHDPLANLREVRRILKPDGCFLFRVPMVDSLDARLFGPYWAGLDSPRHLTVFSRATLRQMLIRAGLKPLRLWGLGGGYFSFAISLRLWAEAAVAGRGMRQFLVTVVDSAASRLLTAPIFWVIDRLNLGAQLTVLAVPQAEVGDD